jgi:hypothetical protein
MVRPDNGKRIFKRLKRNTVDDEDEDEEDEQEHEDEDEEDEDEENEDEEDEEQDEEQDEFMDDDVEAPKMKKIIFKTWKQFDEDFKGYCDETFQVFRVRSSKSVDTINSGQTKFLYPKDCGSVYTRSYVCTHGWKPRKRGKEIICGT